MSSSTTTEPRLPYQELAFGRVRALKSLACRIGRPDLSLTFDEFIAFMDEQDLWSEAGRNPGEILQWFEPLARFYTTCGNFVDYRRALFERAPSGLLNIDELAKQMHPVREVRA